MPRLPSNSELGVLVPSPLAFFRRHAVPLVLMLIGAVADGYTTYINMRQFGPEIELHPAQRIVSQLVGVSLGVPLAKLIQVAFVLFLAAAWRQACNPLLYACALLYALAAANNHFLWL